MKNNQRIGIEIERKYIIKMPDIAVLSAQPSYRRYEIVQTYLNSIPGVTRRVRSLSLDGATRYIETVKVRIDQMSSTEVENDLTKEQYLELLEESDPAASPITKVRHRFFIDGQPFEVDIYPQWQNTAIMETELENREKEVKIPSFIEIIREVTGEKSYTNASMSREFPKELSHLVKPKKSEK